MPILTLGLWALVSDAVAWDRTGVWWRETAAAALTPSGVLVESAAELRAPILRYGGVAFNDTFAGVGGRVSATPAFAEAAARVSAQPIDLLPVTAELVVSEYWRSPFGLLAFPESDLSGGSDDPVRKPRYEAGEGFSGHMVTFLVNPTFQIRVGKVVALSSWSVAWVHMVPDQAQTDPWVYEPYRGMVIGWDDVLTEHTSGVLWEPKDGSDGALVRAGAVLRGRFSQVTPDVMLSTGALGQWRPKKSPEVPTFTSVLAWYLRDTDYVGPVPFFALVATWEGITSAPE